MFARSILISSLRSTIWKTIVPDVGTADTFGHEYDKSNQLIGSYETETFAELVLFVHDIMSIIDGVVNRGHKPTNLSIMDFARPLTTVADPERVQGVR